jgi:nucleotide-binding universal stress UspA family protein
MSLPPSTPPEPLVDVELGRGILDRILCGVDSSPEGIEALRQANRLREPGGSVDVVTALELASAAEAGWAASVAADQLELEAQAAADAARAAVPDAGCRVVQGRADQVLLAEADSIGATLLAVGTHEISRPVGIAIGSVATAVLHSAPCSVLIARRRPAGEQLPRRIVVGVDGSDESALAAAVAFGVGERFGVEVRPIAARGGKGFDLARVNMIARGVWVEDRAQVDALVAGVEATDLLVVGSRSLHGARALGSVSERVAHKAPCSVLVVRRRPS